MLHNYCINWEENYTRSYSNITSVKNCLAIFNQTNLNAYESIVEELKNWIKVNKCSSSKRTTHRTTNVFDVHSKDIRNSAHSYVYIGSRWTWLRDERVPIMTFKIRISSIPTTGKSVALVRKILTSLNSTLPNSGQAVSARVLVGIYRSQSALRRRYRASRRNYRPLLEPEWLETIVPITCSLREYALPLTGSYLSYQLRWALLNWLVLT